MVDMSEMKGLLSTDEGVFMVTIRLMQEHQAVPPKRTRRTTWPKTTRIRLLNMQNHRCGICNGPLGLYDSHIDHVVPVVAGGSNDLSNLQLTHMSCNLRKGARPDSQERMPWA